MVREVTLDQRIEDARRVMQLREMQMHSAALARDTGEIDSLDWDGHAARYAAAVREWQALTHHKLTYLPAITETTRGSTWVQQ